ncbi:MAG: hypothetical protein EZS28_023404, partial [Streblomastix strix]
MNDITRGNPRTRDDQIWALQRAMKEHSPQDQTYSKVCGVFSLDKNRFGEIARSERIEKRTIAPARKFTTKQEDAFVKEIQNRYNEGYPFTQAIYTEWIQKDHPQKSPIHGYIQSLLARRSRDIKSQIARPLQRLRFDVKLESAAEYKIKLMEDMDGVPACLVANTDESGTQEYVDSHPVEILCPALITAQQCRYKVERDGKLVSVLACIFLNGDSCAPGIVVKRQSLDDNIFDLGLLNGQDAVIYTSKKGYMTGETFFMWITDVFVPFIKQQCIKYKLRPIREAVLLLDGLGAHFKDETLQLLRTAHIKFAQLPSHTSHAYQPLDLTTFK